MRKETTSGEWIRQGIASNSTPHLLASIDLTWSKYKYGSSTDAKPDLYAAHPGMKFDYFLVFPGRAPLLRRQGYHKYSLATIAQFGGEEVMAQATNS